MDMVHFFIYKKKVHERIYHKPMEGRDRNE